MEFSTIFINKNYFHFLSLSGIFPYKFIYSKDTTDPVNEPVSSCRMGEGTKKLHLPSQLQIHSNLNLISPSLVSSSSQEVLSPSKKLQSIQSIDFHKRGLALIIHLLVMSFFYLYSVFQIFQLLRRAFAGAGAIELFGMSCWLWKLLFVGIFFVHFHTKKKEIADFHTNWHLAESNFYKYWKMVLPTRVPQVKKMLIRHKNTSNLLITTWTLGIIVLLIINHIKVPSFSSYLSSYLGNTLDPEQYYWVLYISITVQGCALFPILLVFNHFHFLCYTFSQSISIALDLISFPFESINENCLLEIADVPYNLNHSSKSKFKDNILRDDLYCKLTASVHHFQSLENLTEHFNKTYKWMFFLYKGIILINLCILIFVPLRFSKLFPSISLLVFFVSALFFIFHLSTALPAMGNVWAKSSNFQKLWIKRLPQVIECGNDLEVKSITAFLKLKGELEGCLPFGIDCGSFYTVTPVSILAFFSICTSYLIVLLQLDMA